MNRIPCSLAVGALMVVSSLGIAPLASAQTAPALPVVPELKPIPAETATWRPLRLRNVRPWIVAGWLDPAHYSAAVGPQAVVVPKKDTDTDAPDKKVTFVLPPGVEAIAPIDAQNTLLVLATEAGFQKLQGLMNFLDKPLRQVEVEAQLVEMKPEDLKLFSVELPKTPTPQADAKAAVNLGFVRGNFQATLNALLAQKRAKVITAPRVTAINSLTSSLATTTSQSAVLATKDDKGHYSELLDQGLLLGRQFKLAVTPTVNNDDTITLLIAPSMTLVVSTDNATDTLVLKDLQTIQAVANARDGDTIALTGFNPQLLSGLADAKSAPASNTVLFITPRIIRRMGDAQVEAVALTR